jgi:hypothetical protein
VVSTHPDGKSLLPWWGFGVLAVVSVGVGVLTALGPRAARTEAGVAGSLRFLTVGRLSAPTRPGDDGDRVRA